LEVLGLYRRVHKSSQRAAEAAFSRLLRNAEFSARIAELQAQAAEGAVMAAREVLIELSKIGRADMADYMVVGPTGDPVLDFSKLTRDQAAALQEVTVEDFLDSRAAEETLEDQAHGGALRRASGRDVRRVRFRLASKLQALELLGKHHKLYVDRHEHDFGAGVAERLAAAIARVEGRGRSADRQVCRPRGGPACRAAHKDKRVRAR
jgi:phage terminase small subunit